MIGKKIAMSNNAGMWFFDEGNYLFFSQINSFNNKGNDRNEKSLLSLSDGREWKHESVNSTNFNMPYTKEKFVHTIRLIDLFHVNQNSVPSPSHLSDWSDQILIPPSPSHLHLHHCTSTIMYVCMYVCMYLFI